MPPFSSSVRTFIFSRIGFSISTALQFSSNVANSRFRAFRWSILMQKKVPRSMSARWQKIRCQDQTSQVLCFMLSNNATVRNFAPSETALIGTVFLLFKNILWSARTAWYFSRIITHFWHVLCVRTYIVLIVVYPPSKKKIIFHSNQYNSRH